MVTKCQDSSSGITRSDKLPGGPCPSSLSVGEAELAAAGLKCPHVCDGMSVSLLGHEHGAKALWDADPSARSWGITLGLLSDRTDRQRFLGLLCAGAASFGTGVKPGGVSSSALSRRGSTESIQVLFEMEFIHMLRLGYF